MFEKLRKIFVKLRKKSEKLQKIFGKFKKKKIMRLRRKLQKMIGKLQNIYTINSGYLRALHYWVD